MPTILRIDGYRFFFFSNEGTEPAHVHVESAECYAKFWLQPVRLQVSGGFRGPELRRIDRLVREHEADLMEAWHEFFRT